MIKGYWSLNNNLIKLQNCCQTGWINKLAKNIRWWWVGFTLLWYDLMPSCCWSLRSLDCRLWSFIPHDSTPALSHRGWNNKELSKDQFSDREITLISHVGKAPRGDGIVLENVLCVTKFQHNLLSVQKLFKHNNYEVQFFLLIVWWLIKLQRL